MDVKSQYKVGDAVQVTIEPHATVGMLSNRIGLIVGSHPKHQFIYHPRDPEAVLDPLAKLKDVMSEKVVLLLHIRMPDTRKVIEELSDDEGVVGEEGPFPDAPVEGECVDVAKRDKLMEECATNPTLENLSARLASRRRGRVDALQKGATPPEGAAAAGRRAERVGGARAEPGLGARLQDPGARAAQNSRLRGRRGRLRPGPAHRLRPRRAAGPRLLLDAGGEDPGDQARRGAQRGARRGEGRRRGAVAAGGG